MLFPAVGIFVCVSSLANAQYLLGLAEGEICNDKQEGQWVCSALKQCTHVDLKILRPAICTFRGRDPIICCPPKKNMSKAEMSCLKHRGLCDQFNMFRNAAGRSLPGKPLEWTDDDDNEAEVLEVPSDAFSESQTRPRDETFTSWTLSPTMSQTQGTEDMVTTTTNAPDDVGLYPTTPENKTEPSTTTVGDIPKSRQFVVGGQLSLPRTHRHVALIGYGPKNNIDWRCGGSLVSDLWVLSAAHCTTTTDLGSAKWARLGELDHSTNTDDARPQDRRIVQRINHPQYKDTLKYNDIALYKLESRVLFDQYVAPICLHTTFDIDQPRATVVGWGRTDFADDLSSRLMEVDITLINNTECRRLYGNGDDTTPQGIERLTMVCAGERDGGKDACTGDSGGPLVINQAGSCLKKQVGITSFGRDCGLPNSPGIYTRVSTYVPWIESIVWP